MFIKTTTSTTILGQTKLCSKQQKKKTVNYNYIWDSINIFILKVRVRRLVKPHFKIVWQPVTNETPVFFSSQSVPKGCF